MQALSDAEVFGTQQPKPLSDEEVFGSVKTKPMSDEEVFGNTNTKAMSDAEVFGTAHTNTYDGGPVPTVHDNLPFSNPTHTFADNVKTAVEGISDQIISGATYFPAAAYGTAQGLANLVDPRSKQGFVDGFKSGLETVQYSPSTPGGVYWQSRLDSLYQKLIDKSQVDEEWAMDKTHSPALAAAMRTVNEGGPQILGALFGIKAASAPHETPTQTFTKIWQEANSYKGRKELGDMIQRSQAEEPKGFGSGAMEVPPELAPVVEHDILKQQSLQRLRDVGMNMDSVHNTGSDLVSQIDRLKNLDINLPNKPEGSVRENILPPSEARLAGESVDSKFNQWEKRGVYVRYLRDMFAKQISNIMKDNPDIDLEKIYHWYEQQGKQHIENYDFPSKNNIDFNIELTPKEKAFNEEFLKPLADYMGYDKGHIHRMAETRTPLLDRIKGGVSDIKDIYNDQGTAGVIQYAKEKLLNSDTYGSGALRTKVSSDKHRVFYMAVDKDGNAKTVAVKGKNVFGFDDENKPIPIGKKPTKTEGQLLKKQTKPLEKRIKDTENRINILQKISDKLSKQNGPNGEVQESNDAINIRSQIIDLQEKLDGPGGLNEKLNDLYDNYNPVNFRNKTMKDSNGKQWRLEDTTSQIIEQETGTTYHKNAAVSILEDFVEHGKADMAKAFLDDIKNSVEFRQFAAKASESNIPSNWVLHKGLDQFRGYRMHPELNNVLTEVAKEMGQVPTMRVPILHQFSTITKNIMFLFPYFHEFNEGFFGIKNRGFQWLNPKSTMQIHELWKRAQQMVDNVDPEYARLYTEQNMALQGLRARGSDIRGTYSDLLGYAYDKPGPIQRQLEWSTGKLWRFSDMVHLRDYLERRMNGMGEEEALDLIHKHFPTYETYRGNKTTSFLQHPDITFFFRYRSFVIKEFITTAKEMVSPKVDMQTRTRALGMMATLFTLYYGVWPQIQQGLRELTGKNDLYLANFGPMAVPRVLDRIKQDHSPMPLLQHFLYFSSGTVEAVGQIAGGRHGVDLRTGAPIVKPEDTGTLKEITERAAHVLSTVPALHDAYQDNTKWNAIISQIGVTIRPTKTKVDKRLEKIQEQTDTSRIIENRLKRIGQP